MSARPHTKVNVTTAAVVRSRFKGLFAHIFATDHTLLNRSNATPDRQSTTGALHDPRASKAT